MKKIFLLIVLPSVLFSIICVVLSLNFSSRGHGPISTNEIPIHFSGGFIIGLIAFGWRYLRDHKI